MLEIEAHRSAIGRFHAVSIKLSSQSYIGKSQKAKELSNFNSFFKEFSVSGINNNYKLFLIICCFFSLAIFLGINDNRLFLIINFLSLPIFLGMNNNRLSLIICFFPFVF